MLHFEIGHAENPRRCSILRVDMQRNPRKSSMLRMDMQKNPRKSCILRLDMQRNPRKSPGKSSVLKHWQTLENATANGNAAHSLGPEENSRGRRARNASHGNFFFELITDSVIDYTSNRLHKKIVSELIA